MQIDHSQMPAPDTMVKCADGSEIAAMFYFAAAEQSLDEIAIEQGFEVRGVSMDGDCEQDLWTEYEDGSAEAMNKWTPTPQEGFTLAAKIDTEDGPCAIFIRPRATDLSS